MIIVDYLQIIKPSYGCMTEMDKTFHGVTIDDTIWAEPKESTRKHSIISILSI